MRLFFAVIFNEDIKDKLYEVICGFKPCCESGRFTQRENLHLTLAFIGETAQTKIGLLKEALHAVNAKPFLLSIGGIGCFRRRGGDVFWAGIERTPELLDIHHHLCTQLQKRGFPVENRVYSPHLTLAREAVLKDGCDRGAFTVPVIETPVEKISLMKSERIGGKLKYTPIDEKYL